MTENRPQNDERSSFENEEGGAFEMGQNSESEVEKSDHFQDKKIFHHLPRQQKIILSVLGALTLGIIVIAIMQMHNIISIPWPDEVNSDSVSSVDYQLEDTDEVAELKSKDTDQDGLTDYEELNEYSTSPYLADSDSDGLSDKEELDVGSDPNCPKGSVCYVYGSADSSASSNLVTEEIVMPTAQELREILLASGEMSEDEVAAFSDQELLEYYQQMLDENPDLQGQISQGAENINTLYNYTPDQIRQLLIDQGMDEQVVNSVDDETLLELYEQALEQVNNNENQ